MKKYLAILLVLTMVFSCFALASCGGEKKKNNNDNTPSGDVGEHTHTGGEATCTKKAVCTVCGEEYGSLAAHDYGEDGICKACSAKSSELEADEKAAAEVIKMLVALGEITEINADNYYEAKTKYDAANTAYNNLSGTAKQIVGLDNRAFLSELNSLIVSHEIKNKEIYDYYDWVSLYFSSENGCIDIWRHTPVLDGEVDDLVLGNCTPMELTKENCYEWMEGGSQYGAGAVGDTSLMDSAETEVRFYFTNDNEYLYITEKRTDSSWNFTATDYTKAYTGDGSIIWFVNRDDVYGWSENGGSIEGGDKPTFGLMWSAGINGEAPGATTPRIAYFPEDDQSAPVEKTASGEWEYAIKWADDKSYYVLEVAIPLSDLSISISDLGNLSVTCCSVDIVNSEFDGDPAKLWTGMGYQMQYQGVNNWCWSKPCVASKG